jgi:hypothetical protein
LADTSLTARRFTTSRDGPAVRPFFSASGERMFVALSVVEFFVCALSETFTTCVAVAVSGDARTAGLAEDTLMLLRTVSRAL